MSLIIYEGIDRSGKDYLANKCFQKMCKEGYDVEIYQDTVNKPDFKLDPINYKFYLIDVNNRKLRMANRDGNLIIVRFYISEIVFSKIFGRTPLIGDIKSFEERITCEDVTNILVKIDYATYVKRCKSTNEKHVYNQKEFNDINSLYEETLNKSKFNKQIIINQ